MSNRSGASRLVPSAEVKAASLEIPSSPNEIPRRLGTGSSDLSSSSILFWSPTTSSSYPPARSSASSITGSSLAISTMSRLSSRSEIIVAANFTAIMAARRNYRLKNLTLFARQARDTIIIWFGVSGTLIVVAFTLKISDEFSRGAATLFFIGGMIILLSWRYLVATQISLALATGSFARQEDHRHRGARPQRIVAFAH